ncbi:HSP20-like chaperone [Exidia glandulosa HHB12029]|uniref:HSP20-like chaperone n=1 Tax=Exidia glandulosa HHB12029 TaxID=1314781 RepID=A0A165EM36_EXIGL|nr:HSP20-like chaperone [Exidia glandulosa HHB12029]
MDVEERPESNETILSLELPGVARDAVGIDVHVDGADGPRLVVSGEHTRLQGSGRLATHERVFGKFERTVRLPRGVTADDVKAELVDGVLTVTYPMRKSVPESESTRVTVN